MKTAAPIESGTANNKASNEETSVPKMNGSAPNLPETGSQSDPKKKCQPNCFSDNCDLYDQFVDEQQPRSPSTESAHSIITH